MSGAAASSSSAVAAGSTRSAGSSPRTDPGIELFAAPGNAGIAELATLVPIEATDVAGIAAWSATERPDLVVVGPDDPLALGIVDALDAARIPVIGPTAAAARIESSKAWAADVLVAAGVPHPATAVFAGPSAVEDAIAHVGRASGSARRQGRRPRPGQGGRGLRHARRRGRRDRADRPAARARASGRATRPPGAARRARSSRSSRSATGREAAIIGSARDHKRLEDGDRGPNTGGMGAFAPVPEATPELLADDRARRSSRRRSPRWRVAAARSGASCTPGSCSPSAGPQVLEFNARLGDPEAQVVLPRLRFDLLDAMLGAASGRLAIPGNLEVQGAAVCVVMASGGYPGDHESGMVIEGLGAIGSDVLAFHAATTRVDGRLVTSGGRVLGITGLGSSVGRGPRSRLRRPSARSASRVPSGGPTSRLPSP